MRLQRYRKRVDVVAIGDDSVDRRIVDEAAQRGFGRQRRGIGLRPRGIEGKTNAEVAARDAVSGREGAAELAIELIAGSVGKVGAVDHAAEELQRVVVVRERGKVQRQHPAKSVV